MRISRRRVLMQAGSITSKLRSMTYFHDNEQPRSALSYRAQRREQMQPLHHVIGSNAQPRDACI